MKNILLASCLLLSSAAARKQLTQTFSEMNSNAQGHGSHSTSPKMEVSSSPVVLDKQFQFGTPDQKIYWRTDMTPPVLRAGWQTEQNANSKDLTFNYNPASFRPNLRLGSNTMGTAAISKTRLPCYPSATGLCDTLAPPATTPPAAPDTAATPTSKKYQYWSVKLKPYIET